MYKNKNYSKYKKFLLMVNETKINSYSYVNILYDILLKPQEHYLLKIYKFEDRLNSNIIVEYINKTIKSFHLRFMDFLLYDKSGNILKIFSNKLIHVTCIMHLLYNLCNKIE